MVVFDPHDGRVADAGAPSEFPNRIAAALSPVTKEDRHGRGDITYDTIRSKIPYVRSLAKCSAAWTHGWGGRGRSVSRLRARSLLGALAGLPTDVSGRRR